MAEGIVRHFYPTRFDVASAGSKITEVHPLAIRVMAELGVDISQQRSKLVTEFTGQEFDYVITLCGGYSKTTCPVFLGKAKEELHWDFIDPAEAQGSEKEKLVVFRKVRDEIKNKIAEFVKQADR